MQTAKAPRGGQDGNQESATAASTTQPEMAILHVSLHPEIVISSHVKLWACGSQPLPLHTPLFGRLACTGELVNMAANTPAWLASHHLYKPAHVHSLASQMGGL